MISPVAGFPRCARNDDRVGTPIPDYDFRPRRLPRHCVPRNDTRVRIAKSHARFIALLPHNRYTLSVQAGIKTQTAISCDDLFGEACYARKSL